MHKQLFEWYEISWPKKMFWRAVRFIRFKCSILTKSSINSWFTFVLSVCAQISMVVNELVLLDLAHGWLCVQNVLVSRVQEQSNQLTLISQIISFFLMTPIIYISTLCAVFHNTFNPICPSLFERHQKGCTLCLLPLNISGLSGVRIQILFGNDLWNLKP